MPGCFGKELEQQIDRFADALFVPLDPFQAGLRGRLPVRTFETVPPDTAVFAEQIVVTIEAFENRLRDAGPGIGIHGISISRRAEIHSIIAVRL